MSSTALERHLDEHAGRPATLAQVLERMRPEIARALPRHLSPDRMLRIALTTLRREPQLAQAPVESLLGSLMLAAQLGLEPGPQGHVYLIPRRIHGVPEIVFVIGYKGLIDLAYRSGLVKEIGAVCVWQGEKFVWREGTSPVIEHEPDPDSEGTEAGFRCAYAIAQLTTGGTPHIVIGRRHITRARQASAIGAGRGPWASDWESMVNKTAIRRLSAFLPMSPEMRSALALDEQPAPHMVAGQVLDLEEAAAAVEHREPDDERTTAGEIVVDAEVAQATEEPAGGQPAGEAAERPRPRRTRRTQEPPAEQSAGATGQVEDAAPGGRRASRPRPPLRPTSTR
jgi:recombination protein RecT